MALRWYTVVVNAHDTKAQAHWWAEVLDWNVEFASEDEAVIVPKNMLSDSIADLEAWMQAGQGMVFVRVPERKTVKNRLHLDLAPHTSQDRDAEIARLLQMGATRTDVGQAEMSGWTVLRDPEGNEFCVLSSRDS